MDPAVLALVPAALDRCAALDGDARESALGDLGRALAAVQGPDDDVERALERLVALGGELRDPSSRVRAFAAGCHPIPSARWPPARRGALLDRALALAEKRSPLGERVDCARAAIEAMVEARWDERAGELYAALARTARGLDDEAERTRALLSIAAAMAAAAGCEDALALVDALPASAARGRCLALVACELAIENRPAEAAAVVARALADIDAAPESFDRSEALQTLLAALLEADLPDGAALWDAALALADRSKDARFQTGALLGAIEAVAASELEPAELHARLDRLGDSIDRIADRVERAHALGELAVSLAALGDAVGSTQVLGAMVELAAPRDGAHAIDPFGDGPSAVPLPRVLAALADAGVQPDVLQRFTERSLELLGTLPHTGGAARLLERIAGFLASPALSYEGRLSLFERALAVARAIPRLAERVEAATTITNGLSLAGADERGDALFTGLTLGIEGEVARKARLARAITLVRLNRTADALAELGAASDTAGAGEPHAIEEIATMTARCGFIGDVLEWLTRVAPERQAPLRAHLADVLVEATHLDPNLRVLGLETLAKDAPAAAAEAIGCLAAQVRMTEGLGDPVAILAEASAHTRALADRKMAAIFDQQLARAATERIRRGR